MTEQEEYVQVTMLLTRQSFSALTNMATLEGITETDIHNRALQVYQHVVMEQKLGKKLAWITSVKRRWFGVQHEVEEITIE